MATDRDLSAPSAFLRSTVTRDGLAAGVDREGGEHAAGVIYNVAVITRGEALGHGVWIDREFLHQTADAINALDIAGIKSRFTHPGLSGDGLGRHLGRLRNALVDGDVVRGDLHISPTAHQTPDGNLAEYVMDLAEIEPDMFGLSIVFSSDLAAEDNHKMENESSPDPANAADLPHARLLALRAVDVVDEPAANPAGLFHRGDEIAGEAERLLSFALGLSSDQPALTQLDIDPGRVAGFVARFLDRHGLEITKRDNPMNEDLTTETADLVADDTDAAIVDDAETETEDTADDIVDETPVAEAITDLEPVTVEAGEVFDGQRFLDAFGDKGGVWFAEGKTFAEAADLHLFELETENVVLRAENDRLMADLVAGEDEPLSFATADDNENAGIDADARRMGRTAAVIRRSIKINN